MSRFKSIGPEGRIVEADVFIIDTNLVNIYWYPLNIDLELYVKNIYPKDGFRFETFLANNMYELFHIGLS